MEGEDIEAVKAAMEELNTKSQKIGETLYAQTQAEAAQSQAESGASSAEDAGAGAEDDVIDAEVVDEEDENK